jgi:hypothetical protein
MQTGREATLAAPHRIYAANSGASWPGARADLPTRPGKHPCAVCSGLCHGVCA